MSYKYMSKAERSIVSKLIRVGLDAGYEISVNDGEEWTVKRSTRATEIKEALCTTSEDLLSFRKEVDGEVVKARFLLVYNGDETVIADYSGNQAGSEIYDGVEPLIEKWGMEL